MLIPQNMEKSRHFVGILCSPVMTLHLQYPLCVFVCFKWVKIVYTFVSSMKLMPSAVQTLPFLLPFFLSSKTFYSEKWSDYYISTHQGDLNVGLPDSNVLSHITFQLVPLYLLFIDSSYNKVIDASPVLMNANWLPFKTVSTLACKAIKYWYQKETP